ncbi:MAG TPA: YpiF family protein [Candidatus Salinicoccus merdavium]|nr:YpiF family protein [Candidatus Salinicoccus merdavium]
MLYNFNDIKNLKEQVEFVDTAVIPFVSADLDDQALTHANDIELVQLVTIQLEKQFKGRIFITPAMTTVLSDTEVLKQYQKQLCDYGFKNVVILTHLNLDDEFNSIKLNQIPLQDMSNDIKFDLVNDEVKKVMKSIISIWNS